MVGRYDFCRQIIEERDHDRQRPLEREEEEARVRRSREYFLISASVMRA